MKYLFLNGCSFNKKSLKSESKRSRCIVKYDIGNTAISFVKWLLLQQEELKSESKRSRCIV